MLANIIQKLLKIEGMPTKKSCVKIFEHYKVLTSGKFLRNLSSRRWKGSEEQVPSL